MTGAGGDATGEPVTFMLTDVEGSTRLWEDAPEDMSVAVARHEGVVLEAVERAGGTVVKSRGEGDSCFCVFTSAARALSAALQVQRLMLAEAHEEGLALSVRIGLHTGDAEHRDGDYYGPVVNRCARIREVAWGGQTVLSSACAERVADRLPDGAGLLDLGMHHLRDLTRPERIFQLTHPDLPEAFPPVRSLSSFAHNIPEQLSSLVGRDHELREVRARLADARLVTLTGAGGSGKTRLATHVSAEMLEDFPDGVWFVPLAPVTDPDAVLPAISSVLGVHDRGDGEMFDAVVRRVRPARMLLVVDNCEHVIDAAATVVGRLLESCPGLTVLATSREVLGATGEATVRVPPLSVPPDDQVPLAAGLTVWESTKLFVDRARTVDPAMSFSDEDADSVAQICRRLDGIPLAIELAAARVNLLRVAEIAARLDNRFTLLTGGARTALPHQQTLQATVDWSYELLSEAERGLLRRLGVFAGGFTLEAAEEVCADSGTGAASILDLLGRLVAKSLVVRETASGPARFGMLETIRAYALARAEERGELPDAEWRYLDWCVRVSQDAERGLFGGQQRAALARLSMEYGNLRAALDSNADAAERLRLAALLGPFWWIRGSWSTGRRRLMELLDLCPHADGRVRLRALFAAGLLTAAQEDYVQARRSFDDGIALARTLNDTTMLGRLLAASGMATMWSDLPAAWKLVEDGLGLSREAEDAWGVGYGTHVLAMILAELGERAVARTLLAESLTLRREIGDVWGVSFSIHALAHFDLQEGRTAPARAQLEECLAIRRELEDAPGTLAVLAELAQVAEREGDSAAAKDLLDEGLALRRRIDQRAGAATLQFRLGYAALERGELDEARRYFEVALQYRRRLGDPRGIALSLHDLGTVARLQGDMGTARELADEALALAREIDHAATRCTCLSAFAPLLAAAGDDEGAAVVNGAVAGLRDRAGVMDPPYLRAVAVREAERVRSRLGPDAYDEAVGSGRALSFEDALSFVSVAGATPGSPAARG